MNVSGKHVIVSAGGSGVRKKAALAFSEAGAGVTVYGRLKDPLCDVAEQNQSIECAVCDVTNSDLVSAEFEHTRELKGPVSIAVADAGVVASAPFEKMSSKQLQSMVPVNLLVVFNVWQAAIQDMKMLGWARLLSISSTAGLKGYTCVSCYIASKHAVMGLVRSEALELGQSGITANAICPGFMETPLLERSIRRIIQHTNLDEGTARKRLLNIMWDVLRTMTPAEYALFREKLVNSSGFQSYQYRMIEFILGNRNLNMLRPNVHEPYIHKLLVAEMQRPSFYDYMITLLFLEVSECTKVITTQSLEEPHTPHRDIQAAWATVYRDDDRYWMLYELGEKLVDLENYFRRLRFNHVTTVERIIGFKRGSGETSGLEHLRRMLDVRLFPELWDVRGDL